MIDVTETIRLAANMLQLQDLLKTTVLGGTQNPTTAESKELDLLCLCFNFTNSIIAGEHIKLKRTILVETEDGMIDFGVFAPYKLNEILKVSDEFGASCVYKQFDSYLKTQTGKLELMFSYYPAECDYDQTLSYYNAKLNDRIFAYGVASEYSFIKAMYDDATMWDARFKDALQVIGSKKSEIQIKKRRWV